MKHSFALAALLAAASAKSCSKIERKLNRWIDIADARIARTEGRMDSRIAMYTDLFNSDDNNADRVADITADELADFIFDEVIDAIDEGTFDEAMFWERDVNVDNCADLEDLFGDYEDAVDEARSLQECWTFLTDEETGPVAADPAAYFSCANAAFASESWCVAE